MSTGDFETKHGDRLIKLGLYTVTLVFGLVLALKLRVPPVIDEVGTIANPALLMGYDWSQTIYAMGGCYFKYGTVLLYYPLMKLFTDSYMLYKAMLAVNVILYAFIPVIAYDILKKHLGVSRTVSAIIALTTAILPSTVLYTLYARADAMLIFLPWPMALIILKLMSLAPAAKKSRAAMKVLFKRIVLSIVLAVLTGYAYMSHTRGIVLVLAVTLGVLLIRLICRRKTVEWISYVITLGGTWLLDKRFSAYFYDILYSRYGTNYSSVESYDFEYLKLIFTGSGFASFAKLIGGTAFNILASSYGLAGIAVIGGIILLIMYLVKRSTSSDAEIALTIFALLSFCGTFVMSCIYFFPYVHPIYSGEISRRVDWLVYGRYAACSLGPAVMTGLYYLICRNGKDKKETAVWVVTKLLTIIGCVGAGLIFMYKIAPVMEGAESVSRNYIQICTFLKLNSAGGTTAVFENLGESLLKAGILGGGVGLLMLLLSIKPLPRSFRLWTLGALFIAASVFITLVNYGKIRYGRDEYLYNCINEPAELIEELKELAGEYPVVVDSSAKDLKHYQYVCKEFVIGTVDTDAYLCPDYFVVAKKKYFKKIYGKGELYTIDCFDYDNATKDIVYVRGEGLAKRLETMGYPVTEYSGKYK